MFAAQAGCSQCYYLVPVKSQTYFSPLPSRLICNSSTLKMMNKCLNLMFTQCFIDFFNGALSTWSREIGKLRHTTGRALKLRKGSLTTCQAIKDLYYPDGSHFWWGQFPHLCPSNRYKLKKAMALYRIKKPDFLPFFFYRTRSCQKNQMTVHYSIAN